jgi:hypothetical protein
MSCRVLVAACIAALCASHAARAQPASGQPSGNQVATAQAAALFGQWSTDPGTVGITRTSPVDARGQRVVYVQQYAQPYVGSFAVWFGAYVDQMVTGFPQVKQKSALKTDEFALPSGGTRTLWSRGLRVVDAQGAEADVNVFGYRQGNQAQLMLIFAGGDVTASDARLQPVFADIDGNWKAGSLITADTAPAASGPRPGPYIAPAARAPSGANPPPPRPAQTAAPTPPPVAPSQPAQPAARTAERPCVPIKTRVNYPRAVSRQTCNYIGGRSVCSTQYSYEDNYVELETGCR